MLLLITGGATGLSPWMQGHNRVLDPSTKNPTCCPTFRDLRQLTPSSESPFICLLPVLDGLRDCSEMRAGTDPRLAVFFKLIYRRPLQPLTAFACQSTHYASRNNRWVTPTTRLCQQEKTKLPHNSGLIRQPLPHAVNIPVDASSLAAMNPIPPGIFECTLSECTFKKRDFHPLPFTGLPTFAMDSTQRGGVNRLLTLWLAVDINCKRSCSNVNKKSCNIINIFNATMKGDVRWGI